MTEETERLSPLVRALALAAALDADEAAAVADAALRELASRTDPEERITRADETVRNIAKQRAGEQGGRRSPLVDLPGDAAARAAGPELDLEAVFGDIEPDAAGFMLLEAANRLPARYRIPLLLSLVEDLSPAEIADVTGGTAEEAETTLTAAHRLYEREIRFAIRESA